VKTGQKNKKLFALRALREIKNKTMANCDYCDNEFNYDSVGIIAYGESGGVTLKIDGYSNTKLGSDAMRFCSVLCFKKAKNVYSWTYSSSDCPLSIKE
jgi:hypothetical protein